MDLEKSARSSIGAVPPEAKAYMYDNGAVPEASFEVGETWYAKSQRFAGKFKIEQRGIERVPENERTDKSPIKPGTMWLAANMVVSSFAIGILGQQVFYMGFVDSVLVILFFNLLGILPVCFFSTFGPIFGLRQMVLSRFYFGWWGVKLITFLNILACLGWSAVNAIVGAQMLNAVNTDVPGWAGILIVAFGTLFVTMFGYKVVHMYEFWSWIPTFIVFLILLGEFAHSGAWRNVPMGMGDSEIGSVLSFGSVVFGFATGWTIYAADYTVYQRVDVGRKKIFFWTWIGLAFPLLFTQMLGAAMITAISYGHADTNPFVAGYNQSQTGGLIGAALFPTLGGFGKFCVVILALSIIANNCPNIYSFALAVQVLGRWTQHVPRFLWTLVGTGIYIAIAIPAYTYFEQTLHYFMDFIAYWLAVYEGIALTEHFVFRRGLGGYKPEQYDSPGDLPPGFAAFAAFLFGVVGFVMGMSQPWYVGEIAILIGVPPFGGDVGTELAFGFSAVVYLALRPIERAYFKR